MKIVHIPGETLDVKTAVTVGVFDGVHRGHHALLEQVHAVATSQGLPTVVLTFSQHPAQVVRPESAPKLLTTLDQKLELLDELGIVDICAVLTFDDARRKESAAEFVTEVLVNTLQVSVVMVGEDFHFGKDRGGNVQMLKEMGKEFDFTVESVPLVTENSQPISSTRIRELLISGDLATANELLGRPFELRGTVVHGDGRGAELGYRTANVETPQELLLPKLGIYAGTFIDAAGIERTAAISVGLRPTFYDQAEQPVVEAHLLDFDDDLYDQHVRVRFHHHLRDEMKFDNVKFLIDQIEKDILETRQLVET